MSWDTINQATTNAEDAKVVNAEKDRPLLNWLKRTISASQVTSGSAYLRT